MNKNLRVLVLVLLILLGLIGVLLVLVGLIWTLQGVGVLPGSVMTGVTFWAIIGPIVAIIGAVLVAVAVRTRRSLR